MWWKVFNEYSIVFIQYMIDQKINHLIKAIFSLNNRIITKNRLYTKNYLNIDYRLIYNIKTSRLIIYSYLFDISQYILLPIYSFIRLFVYSFDVIHTLGFYSWGIKIDAIPGRINLATTLRLLWKGEYRGKCFELCGQGHLSMIINALLI